MQLIQNGSPNSPTMPAKQPPGGTPGYANNQPGAQPSTVLDGDIFNTILAEIINVIAAAGITLDPTDNAQLLAAIRAITSLGFTPVQQGGGAGQSNNKLFIGWDGSHTKIQVDSTDQGEIAMFSDFNGFFGGVGVFDGWQRLPSGVVIQWFELSLTTQTLYTNITYPTAFPNVCYSIVANIGTSITATANDYGIGVQANDQFSFNIIIASPFPPGGNAGVWCMAIGH